MDTADRRKHLRWLSALVLALLLALGVWMVLRNGEKWLQQIGSFTWHPRWLYLSASVVLLGLSYYFIPAGWVILAERAGSRAEKRQLRAAWFMSQLGRYVPGKVWLFAGRAAFLRSRGLTGYRATSVPFLELLFTAAGAGLAALPAVLLSGGPVFSSPALKGALIAAGTAILIIPLLRPLQRWLYRLKYGSAPVDLPLPGPSGTLLLLVIYACLWWIRGVSLYLWLYGFGLSGISPGMCLAAAPLSWLAGYIVFLVPGGIGVREAAVTAMVAPAGLTGPVLAVIAGQRLILSVLEVSFALAAAGRIRMFGKVNGE
ncbi:MAG: lysylphosphatidylglycerol synthase domain-containing protein [Candidatus Aegiribacteria sp.]